MNITIKGYVFGIAEDYSAILLLLEQREGTRTNKVAVRCWSNSVKERAQQFGIGDLVEAFGKISSRQGKNGDRWFTSFEAEALRLVEATELGRKDPEPGEPLGDDKVPF